MRVAAHATTARRNARPSSVRESASCDRRRLRPSPTFSLTRKREPREMPECDEGAHDLRDGKTDDVRIGAIDLRDGECAETLDRVAARLVVAFAGVDVARHLRRGERAEEDARRHGLTERLVP